MSEAEDTIIEFLKGKAEAAGEEPYLLSFAGPDMTDAEIDYRAMLEGEKLKAFIERTQGEGRYRVVKHPTQRAKIGIVKHGSEFEFDAADMDEPKEHFEKVSERRNGSALLGFVDALSKLPPQSLEGFVIPARVLVELARTR